MSSCGVQDARYLAPLSASTMINTVHGSDLEVRGDLLDCLPRFCLLGAGSLLFRHDSPFSAAMIKEQRPLVA